MERQMEREREMERQMERDRWRERERDGETDGERELSMSDETGRSRSRYQRIGDVVRLMLTFDVHGGLFPGTQATRKAALGHSRGSQGPSVAQGQQGVVAAALGGAWWRGWRAVSTKGATRVGTRAAREPCGAWARMARAPPSARSVGSSHTRPASEHCQVGDARM